MIMIIQHEHENNAESIKDDTCLRTFDFNNLSNSCTSMTLSVPCSEMMHQVAEIVLYRSMRSLTLLCAGKVGVDLESTHCRTICQIVDSHDRCLQVRARFRNSRSDPLVSCIPNPVSKKGNTRILTKNWMRLGRLQHPYS